jgi:hypothetical protein
MTDNLYVLESWARTRIDELHAAAARDRLLAARPAPPSLARRAVSTVLGFLRLTGELASAQHPR